MIDGLIDAIKVLLLIAAAIFTLTALPLAICAMYERACADDVRMGEQYWLEHGYDLLDESSTGKEAADE